jgi:hypothetical protein
MKIIFVHAGYAQSCIQFIMAMLHRDLLFAPLDADLHLERVAGGNETEVYCSDDRRYVVKVKCDDTGSLETALAKASARRIAAHAFADAIGEPHRIPTYFIVGAAEGSVQPIAIQPYYRYAHPLFSIDYAALSRRQRWWIANQLLHIIGRNVRTLLTQGWMPDIYGRINANSLVRKTSNSWRMLPWRLWGFLFKRNLLRSHNLLLTSSPERRIVLIDYDPIPYGRLYQLVYYLVRLVLFLRDLILLFVMLCTGYVPPARCAILGCYSIKTIFDSKFPNGATHGI